MPEGRKGQGKGKGKASAAAAASGTAHVGEETWETEACVLPLLFWFVEITFIILGGGGATLLHQTNPAIATKSHGCCTSNQGRIDGAYARIPMQCKTYIGHALHLSVREQDFITGGRKVFAVPRDFVRTGGAPV